MTPTQGNTSSSTSSLNLITDQTNHFDDLINNSKKNNLVSLKIKNLSSIFINV
jgi:hypothetical protein